MLTPYHAIDGALQILGWLIIADIILTWIPAVSSRHPAVVLLRKITGPILDVFRRLLPPQRMGNAFMDFSPILALLAIWVLRALLRNLMLGH